MEINSNTHSNIDSVTNGDITNGDITSIKDGSPTLEQTETESTETASSESASTKAPYVFEEDAPRGDNRRHIPIDKIVVGEDNSRLRDIADLAESIEISGIKIPLRVQADTYQLLGGRRRLEACRRLKFESLPVEMVRCTDDEAELEIIDDNLHHLPLTVLEQGEHLLKREALLIKLGKRAPSNRPKKSAEFAHLITTKDEGRSLHMSRRTAQERKSIAKNLTAESKDLVRNTPLAQNAQALKRLSALDSEEQTQVLNAYLADAQKLELVKPGTTDKQSSTLINKNLKLVKRNNRISQFVHESQVPLIELGGRYPVVYADPPWRYTRDGEPTGGAPENNYETMTIQEICDMGVPTITHDDAILFLWVTRQHLPQALAQVMPAWGFEYVSFLVWEKDTLGQGAYSRENSELLVIGKKGSVPSPRPEDLEPSVIKAPRAKHAQKPDRFYEIIEKYYPEFPKIELFCRSPRAGWAAYGNEIIPRGEFELTTGFHRMTNVMNTIQQSLPEYTVHLDLVA